MSHTFPLRRVLCALTALVLGAGLLWFSTPVSAETEDRLAQARADLEALEARLQITRAEGAELEERLAWTHGLIGEGQERVEELSDDLTQSERDIQQSKVRVEILQGRFDEVVRGQFMDGGATPLMVLFEEDDTGTMQQKMLFLKELALHQVELAEQTEAAREAMEAQTVVTGSMMSEQHEILSGIRDSRMDLLAQSQELRDAFAAIDRSRDELLEVVSRLKGLLTQSDYERLTAAFKGKDSISYGDWASLLLAKLRAPQCKENMVVMVAWQLNEGTDARWNPLATTYDMPGATAFNYIGVRNFVSLEQGLKATQLTLERGWDIYRYGDIVKSLRACGDAEKTAEAIAASPWCGCGAQYVTELIDLVRNNFNSYAKI